ncbi:hypothetical protein [Novosphingobium sp. KA1]|uniref:hypothetical protein n=1 Tax=Novosphingobium sp. (strain KA1) TaxID=164608 RepID=UPI001A8DCDD1|nr:hypothetical protein [Novosphingobium sp. KA1]QSR18143.1 hypothetical protein CA833_13235 [Novosphingobium sp. KA1]
MGTWRVFFRQYHKQALVFAAIALCLKALLPTGFMPGQGLRAITIEICHDASGGDGTLQMLVPLKTGGDHVPGKPAKGECPFGALSMVSLGGADPVLLALAIAFIVALGFAPVRAVALAPRPHLRPPLRGPPA